MPKEIKVKSRDEITIAIAVTEEKIEDALLELPKLFPEFSLEWLVGILANYKQFLNYCDCVVVAHNESKKSK